MVQVILALAVILIGCSAGPLHLLVQAQPSSPQPQAHQSASDQAPIVPGALLVRFSPEAAQAVEHAKRAGGQRVGIASVDALFAQYGVSAVEPVFPDAQDPEAIKAKYPKRSQRIPPGAEVPDLSRAYLVRLSPQSDVHDAAAAFARDPSVESAQPNYLVTTQPQGEMP